GFLIDHKPEDAAAVIQLLNQAYHILQCLVLVAFHLVADWPLEVIKRQKDERKKLTDSVLFKTWHGCRLKYNYAKTKEPTKFEKLSREST
ncbi:hypothetical protein KY289_010613, partial [Solanum tuberosum]